MDQKQNERVVTSVATLAGVVDAASRVVDELLGEIITGKVNGESLGNSNTVELVSARVSTHVTASLK